MNLFTWLRSPLERSMRVGQRGNVDKKIRYAHDVLQSKGLLLWSDNGTLNQEFIFAFYGKRGFLLHGLQHH